MLLLLLSDERVRYLRRNKQNRLTGIITTRIPCDREEERRQETSEGRESRGREKRLNTDCVKKRPQTRNVGEKSA